MVAVISPLFMQIFSMSVWVTLLILSSYLILNKSKSKFNWVILIILVLVNLTVNRLLYIKLNPINISFDLEQSYLGYPGIDTSLVRYYKEGLWLPYSFRNIFYSSYLQIFPWIGGIAKLLSPLLWIRLIGFSGFYLLFLGIISFFNIKFKNIYYMWYFLLIILSSALRVLGDSATAVYLALPVIMYWIYLGVNNKYFKKYFGFWCGLLMMDILLI